MRNEGREINEFLNEWTDVSAWESKVVGWGRRGGCDSRRAFNSLGEGAKGRKGALRRDTTSKNERRVQKVKKRGGEEGQRNKMSCFLTSTCQRANQLLYRSAGLTADVIP